MQLLPPVVKIDVALTQILVMTELTIRVEQSQVYTTESKMKFLNKIVIAWRAAIVACCIMILGSFMLDAHM